MNPVFSNTPQQQAFLDEAVRGKGHVALMARAGCGKTSSILKAIDVLVAAFPRAEIQVCAFNKSIAEEVGAKLKAAGHTNWKQVQASTLHSMGYGLMRFAFNLGRDAIDDKKVKKLISAQVEAGSNNPIWEQYPSQIEQLVGLAKDAGFGFFGDKQIGDFGAWYALAEHFDVNGLDDTSEADAVIDAAQTIYRASLAQTQVIDFSDMILMPLVKNLRVKFGKDIIIGDEFQDMSPAKVALVRKFLKPHTGRLFAVGDDRQAIYGFSGADADAMPNVIQQMNMKVLPLSVTWRCPKSVVALAQTIVPDIEAAPDAAEGEVLSLRLNTKEDEEAWYAGIQLTDAILCRNTAPLITLAYSLIRRGKPCKVEGRSIGEGLIGLVQRWKVTTIAAFLTRLDAYRAREVQKAMAKGDEAKQQEAEDKCDTLAEIADACIKQGKKSVGDMVAFINDLFADGATGVTVLCTGHRAKGREWLRVFIWEYSTRCPSKAARQPWQVEQEQNLMYVMLTRAQETLVFVN